MEEGADVIVTREILDESRILVGELVDLLAKTDACGIDNSEVASKGLQEFDGAGLKHRPSFLVHSVS
jgi:hypothetical protein